MSTHRSPPRATMAEVRRLAHEADEFAEFEAVAMATGMTPEECDEMWRCAPPQTIEWQEKPEHVVAEPDESGAWISISRSATVEASR